MLISLSLTWFSGDSKPASTIPHCIPPRPPVTIWHFRYPFDGIAQPVWYVWYPLLNLLALVARTLTLLD